MSCANLNTARQALWEHPDQRLGRDPVLCAAVEAMDLAAERIAALEVMVRRLLAVCDDVSEEAQDAMTEATALLRRSA